VYFAGAAYPQPPEYLLATEVTSSSVGLSWNSSIDTESTVPVKYYVVQYRHNGSAVDFVELSVWKSEVSVVGLEPEMPYEFRVIAVNVVGRSHNSSSIVITTSRTGFMPLSYFIYLEA